MFTEEQIIKMFNNCNFDELSENNYGGIIHHMEIPSEFGEMFCASGVSKLAIWFENVKDYVIKIPFQGQEEGYNYYSVWNSKVNSDGQRIYTRYYRRYEGEGLARFFGAENSINFWDYCRREMETYSNAEMEGVEEFFAETYLIGYVKDYPIYAQERADSIGYEGIKDIEYTDEEEKRAKEISSMSGRNPLSMSATIAAIKHYGEKKIAKFFEFVNNYYINDLHSGNFGLMNGRFVIIDYSGFNE